MQSPFFNRLTKRKRHLGRLARRWPTQAWRVYDRDIPEYPWTVDIYGEHILAQEFLRRRTPEEEREAQHEEVLEAIKAAFSCEDDKIFLKSRVQRARHEQYEKLDSSLHTFLVQEADLWFEINLSDYIDTGLFLDHRPMRRMVHEHVASRSSTRLLNLFAYTGSFSVYAAHAGAHTTTVDMSNTYIAWAKRNFEHNQLSPNEHVFINADIMQWLPREIELGRRYDVIVLDPPTFSRSKKMTGTLDVQRDHVQMLTQCRALLRPGGTLYFSNNLTSFRLDESVRQDYIIEDITRQSIPEDFRHKIHHAYRMTAAETR